MRDTGPTDAVRSLVKTRDGGCVLCGTDQALQVHHRRPRGMGGSKRPDTNLPHNLLTLCLSCHGWVEGHRREALRDGLLVSQWGDPGSVAVRLMSGWWVLLGEDGTTHPIP